MLLRGEAWESVGGVVGDGRDEVVALFSEVQTARERVYTKGQDVEFYQNLVSGITVSLSKDTGAETDVYSPMM